MKTRLLALFVCLIFSSQTLSAQWNLNIGPPDSRINTGVSFYKGHYFISTGYLIFRSNDGLNWEAIPFSKDAFDFFAPRFFTYADQTLLLATSEGLFKADDDAGMTYTKILDQEIHELIYKDSLTIFAYTYGSNAKFHLSHDGGQNWTSKNTEYESLRGLVVHQGEFVMRYLDILCRIDEQLETVERTIPEDVLGNDIINIQGVLFINNSNTWDDAAGLWASNDGGLNWSSLSAPTEKGYVHELLYVDGKMYITTFEDIIYTTDTPFGGNNWQELRLDLKHYREYATGLSVVNGQIFANYGEYNLVKSEDAGNSWKPAFRGIRPGRISPTDFWITDGLWFYSDFGTYPHISTDLGQTWNLYFSALTDSTKIGFDSYVRLDSQTLVANTVNGGWRSVDNGQSWENAGAPRYVHQTEVDSLLYSISAAGFGGSLRRSVDLGQTWEYVRALNDPKGIWTQGDSIILVSTDNQLLRSEDGGLNWTEVLEGFGEGSWYSHNITPFGNQLFVADDGLYRSEDEGLSWTPLSSPLPGFEKLKEVHTVQDYLVLISDYKV
ncbi:MAG: hypothetical protein AAFP19_25760, partial [Bacteroidota bacterium]